MYDPAMQCNLLFALEFLAAALTSDYYVRYLYAAKDIRREVQKEIANLETGVCGDASFTVSYSSRSCTIMKLNQLRNSSKRMAI